MRDELDRVRRGGLQFTSEIHQLYLCVGDAANHDSISYPCFDAELLGRMIWGPRWDWDEKSVTLEACVADVHRSAAPALDRDLAPLELREPLLEGGLSRDHRGLLLRHRLLLHAQRRLRIP